MPIAEPDAEHMRPTNRTTLLSQGVVAGLLGYGVLSGLISAVDVANLRSPFHSAAVLGASLFYGITDPAQVQVIPAYVLAYNGAHLLVFIVLGIIGAALATLADRGGQLWYITAFFFVLVSFHAIAAVQAMSAGMHESLSDRSIWVGGIVAGALMGGYLMKVHPRMRQAQRWDV